MKKIIQPCIPDADKYIFSEGIDYSKTGKTSIWGQGDKATLDLLKKIEIDGKWLNLAAGDWGYTSNLLEKADFVVASDIDESALTKLYLNTPKKHLKKLAIKVFDITKKCPFNDNEFDGIFCTGTLHLFSIDILQNIFLEINRVLKSKGRIIIDYATDIKRVSQDGEPVTFGKEPQYKLEEAKVILKKLFNNYNIKMYESDVPEYLTRTKSPYKLSCKFILLVADKIAII